MPVDPNYVYAEVVHPATVSAPRYGCHNHPPSAMTPQFVQGGWTDDGRREMVEIVTRWNPIECGHYERSATDPMCEGCPWRTCGA